MNFDILVPITFLIVVMILIKSLIVYRHKKLVLWHQTMSAAMESGHKFDAELIRKISIAVDPQKSDLKKSILFFCMALIIGLVSFAIPFQDEQGNTVLRIFASIPLGFSIMYLGFWKYWYK